MTAALNILPCSSKKSRIPGAILTQIALTEVTGSHVRVPTSPAALRASRPKPGKGGKLLLPLGEGMKRFVTAADKSLDGFVPRRVGE
jgi:hypothetical protein